MKLQDVSVESTLKLVERCCLLFAQLGGAELPGVIGQPRQNKQSIGPAHSFLPDLAQFVT